MADRPDGWIREEFRAASERSASLPAHARPTVTRPSAAKPAATVETVRDLHQPNGWGDGCVICGDSWPCRTRRGLDDLPAAPAVEADLREQLIDGLGEWGLGVPLDALADALLAGPLRSLVEQAAEAARLRETVARVEMLDAKWRDGRLPDQGRAYDLRRALDGEQ